MTAYSTAPPWIALAALAALAAAPGCDGDGDDDDSAASQPASVVRDLVYAGEPGGSELAGDLFLPARDGPVPAVVLFHGGGFFQGSRDDLERLAGELQAAGVAAFNVDYRLVGVDGGEFPGAVIDAQDAVRFLRSQGPEWGVDGVAATFGTSAGGTLAALAAGLTDDPYMARAGWPDWAGTTDRVGAFAASSGVYDFTSRVEQHGSVPPMEIDFLGGEPDDLPDRYVYASPITHAAVVTGPVLLLHGEADGLVEPQQARDMADALTAAGVDTELQLYPDGMHGFMFPIHDDNPDGADALARLVAFVQPRTDPVEPGASGPGTRRCVQSGTASWHDPLGDWAGTESYRLEDGDETVCERSYTTAGVGVAASPPTVEVTYTLTAGDGDCAGAPYAPADGETWTLLVDDDPRRGASALFRDVDGLGAFRWFDVDWTPEADAIGYVHELHLPPAAAAR